MISSFFLITAALIFCMCTYLPKIINFFQDEGRFFCKPRNDGWVRAWLSMDIGLESIVLDRC